MMRSRCGTNRGLCKAVREVPRIAAANLENINAHNVSPTYHDGNRTGTA